MFLIIFVQKQHFLGFEYILLWWNIYMNICYNISAILILFCIFTILNDVGAKEDCD